jgi:cell wall-associated NlpC family hydrolase
MRPRPQLDSDLGTTKSSSGNNKQKENKNKHGSRFGITGSIFALLFFHLQFSCPGLALLNKNLGVSVLKNLKKISYLSFCALFISFVLVSGGAAQERQRIVKTISSRPTNQPPTAAVTTDKTRSLTSSIPSNAPATRPILTNTLVVPPTENKQSLVKKTVSSMAMNPAAASLAAGRLVYQGSVSAALMRGIESRFGLPYRYGSTGPNRYDCSGFVWSVFNEAGINFTRQSARSLWSISEPVTGDERFKFGTLVFLNGLGHIGIVADENGFYHASSSKGITYSTFKGYWEGRIVGFRRLPTTVKETVETSSLGK